MNKSESIANLALALVGFQSEVATIGTDKKNPFFKNEYATLGQLIEETKPLREKYGLAVSQIPIGEGGLITMLLHSSGEYLSAISEIRLEAEKGNSLAQSAGKLITYQRRYAYAAILGLVSDKDADGNLKEPTPTPSPSNAGTDKWKDVLSLLTRGTDKQKETLAKMLSSSQCNEIIGNATGDWESDSGVDVIKAVGLFLKLTVGQPLNRYALAVAMSFCKDEAIVDASIKSLNEGKKSGKDALVYFTNLKDIK